MKNKPYHKMYSGYEDLARCVVAQACEDYVDLMTDRYRTSGGRRLSAEQIKHKVKELNDFFMSDRCYLYCGLDGGTILSHLKERIRGRLNGKE